MQINIVRIKSYTVLNPLMLLYIEAVKAHGI